MNHEQISKFFTGELTPEEKESLLASFAADEKQFEEAAKLKNSWAAAQLTITSADKEIAHKGWKMFRININRQKYRIGSWQYIAAAAVMTGFIFTASFFAGYFVNQNKSVEIAYHTLTVPAGQYAQLTLADGSEIWLNSRSKLIYPERFTSVTREIQLEGEGLFKVVSDSKRPFIVKTEAINVIATGTQFNVSAYPNDNFVTTTLIEGIVNLFSDVNDIDYKMKSGQIAIYDRAEQLILAHDTDTGVETSWIHGEYQFKETTLADIAKRLERIYNVGFLFYDEALKQRKFTGTFYNHQSIETILQIIEISTNMKYSMENNIVYFK